MFSAYEAYRDWRITVEEPVTDPLQLRDEGARSLYEWWTRVGREGMPRRGDFDIVDHKRLAAGISLVQVEPGPVFVSRILGERIMRFVGPEWKRLEIRPGCADEQVARMHRYYCGIVESRRPWQCAGNVILGRNDQFSYEGVDLPLTVDGSTVSHLIGYFTVVD